ncbi:MAG: hypothetical protein RL038_700, partial [Actinomycetota bacterium]
MSKAEERRTQAEAARKAASSAEKKERMIRNIGAAVVVAIVAVIIGIGVLASGDSDTVTPSTGTVPSAVDQSTGAWTVNPDSSATAVLETFEDFQCPGCGAFEAIFGDAMQDLIDEDVVKVVYRPAVFLDDRIPGSNSARALNALGCAINQDKGFEYKALVYAAQPTTEGQGWTDGQLTNLGAAAGVADQDAFAACVADGDHLKWGAVADEAFGASGVSSTPTIRLNGTEIPAELISNADPEAFIAWVK